MTHDHTLANLAANPALAAEVDLDHLPDLLGEMERNPGGPVGAARPADEPARPLPFPHRPT